ncbi:hypothetical protein ACIQ7Q_04440 [Streptomyces sp. NPDC096176]|uniref:hypothetical protein n=1 Tax=Streptomyces sp. NPDC096176 TaxID=3366079 RepID=UPI0037FC3329
MRWSAYHELETAGIVKTRRGSGTQVVAPASMADSKEKLVEQARLFATVARPLNATDEEALAAVRHALASSAGSTHTQPHAGRA